MTQTTSPTINRARLDWVDYAKAIGIFLVVVGHVLRGLVNNSILEQSQILVQIDKWIYAFHMPLFFFISGLFVKRSLSKSLTHFFHGKLSVIAYPYFLWSIIQITLQRLTQEHTNQSNSIINIWKIIYQPYEEFWFLYTLFVILVIYAILYKLKISPLLFLVFSIFLYTLYIIDWNLGSWSILYLVRYYAIYFALGTIFGDSKFINHLHKIKKIFLCFISLIGYITVAFAIKLEFDNYIIAIPSIATIGIISSLAFAVFLEKIQDLYYIKHIKLWGLFSLEIYVVHSIAASSLRILLQKNLGITEPIIHLLLETAVGIYIPIILSLICLKIGFPYMFKFRPLKI